MSEQKQIITVLLLRIVIVGTSLVIQWLMLWVRVQSLVGEIKSCMPCSVGQKKKKSYARLRSVPGRDQ